MSIQVFYPFFMGLFVLCNCNCSFLDSIYCVILTSHVFVDLFLFSVILTVSCSWCLPALHVLDIVSAGSLWGAIWNPGWLYHFWRGFNSLSLRFFSLRGAALVPMQAWGQQVSRTRLWCLGSPSTSPPLVVRPLQFQHKLEARFLESKSCFYSVPLAPSLWII